MRTLRLFLFCLALLGWGLTTGCERNASSALSAEADDPNYRQAQQLGRQGRSQEALAFYLKLISKRGDSAPESHLEAGLIYLQHIKDPLAAIYHFRKYLELQPNSRQAVYVRGLVDTAKREFARTLPAQPLESQAERLDMLDQIERLQRDNEQLRAELAAARAGGGAVTVTSRATLQSSPPVQRARSTDDSQPRPFFTAPAAASAAAADSSYTPAAAEEESPVSLAREEPVASAPAATRPNLGIAQPPTRPTLSRPTPPAGSARRHTVQKGDTLFNLAHRYYGDRSRWRDIYQANRDQMPSENSIRIGMELRIP